MSDIDAFVIDDDFDPLADLSLDDGERDDAEADYLPPIPDADKSVVPPVVPLSPAERIEKLLAGIPGQQCVFFTNRQRVHVDPVDDIHRIVRDC